MRCAIKIVLLMGLFGAVATAEVRDLMIVAVDAQGNDLRAELYLKKEGFELLGPSGRAYAVEMDPFTLKNGQVRLRLALIHPDYIGLYEETDFRRGVPVKLKMVPRIRRFELQTDPPGARVRSQQGFLERQPDGSLELDPVAYLPLAGRAGGEPVYQRAPAELTLEAGGYEPTSLTIEPEQWATGQLGSVALPAARGLGPFLTRLRRSPGPLLLVLTLLGLGALKARQLAARARLAGQLESLRADGSDPLAGAELGGYRLAEQLGQGGAAAVYLGYPAASLDPSKAVAVKVVHRQLAQDPDFLQRFYREVEVSGSLVHANIVELKDYGNQDGQLYLVLEYLKGTSLRDKVRPGVPFSQVMDYLRPVAKALIYAHQQGVTHRDLKPENIMVTEQGLKVMDFGFAKKHNASTITATGFIFGTPAYLPPEQARGEASAATDQYAFGVLAFELFTGRLPFEAEEPLALVMQHMSDPPPSPREFRPDLSVEVADVVLKMLAKDPADRYPSMSQAWQALEEASGLATT